MEKIVYRFENNAVIINEKSEEEFVFSGFFAL